MPLVTAGPTFAGSRVVFYQQHDNTILLKILDTASSVQYFLVISAANWTSLKAALAAGGDTYTPASELIPAGGAHTVSA